MTGSVRDFERGSFNGIASSAHIDMQVGSDPVQHFSEKSPITEMDYYVHRGYETPHFHAKKRSGQLIPPTNWRQEHTTGKIKTASWSVTNTPSNYVMWNDGLLPPPWIEAALDWNRVRSWTDADLEERADISYEKIGRDVVQKAAAGIYTRNSWDGLTFVAELHKVKRMFKNLLKDVYKMGPNELSKMWLEGRYGWRILLYDLEDITHQIKRIDDSRVRYKRRSGQSGVYKNIDLHTIEAGPGVFVYSHADEINWSIRGSIIADIEPPRVAFNLVVTGWELITASFVIDWIFNIGQWLETLSFLSLTNNYVAARGIQFDWKTITTVNSFTPTGDFSAGEVSYYAECSKTFTRRLPTSVSKLPHFGYDLDVIKLVDLWALLVRVL